MDLVYVVGGMEMVHTSTPIHRNWLSAHCWDTSTIEYIAQLHTSVENYIIFGDKQFNQLNAVQRARVLTPLDMFFIW